MYQKKIKILVACHKPDKVYRDDVYTPIHVGRAISKYKDEMADMIGDDTGDNISEKNPYYCELTAQYWAWKNLDCEYIGFCHYRRYLKKRLTANNIDKIMNKVDFLVACQTSGHTNIKRSFCNALEMEDVYILYQILIQIYPSKKKCIDKFFFHSNHFYPANIFICRKKTFTDYTSWLFTILTYAENIIRLSPYTRLKRIFGYYGELLLNLYILIHQCKVRQMPVTFMLDQQGTEHTTNPLKKFLDRIIFSLSNQSETWDPAVIVGLENDGIIEKLLCLHPQMIKR